MEIWLNKNIECNKLCRRYNSIEFRPTQPIIDSVCNMLTTNSISLEIIIIVIFLFIRFLQPSCGFCYSIKINEILMPNSEHTLDGNTFAMAFLLLLLFSRLFVFWLWKLWRLRRQCVRVRHMFMAIKMHIAVVVVVVAAALWLLVLMTEITAVELWSCGTIDSIFLKWRLCNLKPTKFTTRTPHTILLCSNDAFE